MIISERDQQTIVVRERGEHLDVLYLYVLVKEDVFFLSPNQGDESKLPGKVEKAILPKGLRIDGSGKHIKLLPTISKQ